MRSKKVRNILVGLLVVSVCVMVLGTGYAAEKIKIRGMRWVSWAEQPALYGKWFDEYMKEHPDVDVKIDFLTTGYGEKLASGFAAGSSPDFYFGGSLTQIKQGWVLPLDNYVTGPNGIDLEDTYDQLWITYKGKKYSYGSSCAVQVAYYNKKLFDEAGVSYPDENWYWDDLAKIASKVTFDTDKDGNPDIWGFQCDEPTRMFVTHVWTQGGKLFSEDMTKALMNGPEGVKAANFIASLTTELGAAPFPGGVGALGYREAFRMGKASMIMDGNWMIQPFSLTKGLDYGVQVVPRDKVRASWLEPEKWVISSQTKHPDITWDVVFKFMLGPDKALEYANFGGPLLQKLPGYKSSFKDTRWRPCEMVETAVKELEYARLTPDFVGQSTWQWDLQNAGLQEIVLTGKDAKEILDRIAKETDKLLKEQ